METYSEWSIEEMRDIILQKFLLLPDNPEYINNNFLGYTVNFDSKILDSIYIKIIDLSTILTDTDKSKLLLSIICFMKRESLPEFSREFKITSDLEKSGFELYRKRINSNEILDVISYYLKKDNIFKHIKNDIDTFSNLISGEMNY